MVSFLLLPRAEVRNYYEPRSQRQWYVVYSKANREESLNIIYNEKELKFSFRDYVCQFLLQNSGK